MINMVKFSKSSIRINDHKITKLIIAARAHRILLVDFINTCMAKYMIAWNNNTANFTKLTTLTCQFVRFVRFLLRFFSFQACLFN